MHMVLAHSAHEICRARSAAGQDEVAASCNAAGLRHYTTALRELRDCIGTGGIWAFDKGLDGILTTIFFMVHYGLQSMASFDQARMHIAGLTSLVATHLQGVGKVTLSPLSSLVLLWILYVSAACAFPHSNHLDPTRPLIITL